MLCGFFRFARLPVASTFWRYVDNLGINQAHSLLNMMSILRQRLWQLCAISYRKVHLDIDTAVETVFGNQQGGRRGHNTKYRGKKGFRPILCYIHETREYLMGKLRTGKTIGWKLPCRFVVMRIPNRPKSRDKPLSAHFLKLLFIAAKVVKESNRHKVKYSIHDARTQPLLNFLNFLDTKRFKPRPWEVNRSWPQRFNLQTS